MQKKIFSVFLVIFLVSFATSAFAGGYYNPSGNVHIDDSFNESYEYDTDIDVDIDDSFNRHSSNNGAIDVHNDDGNVNALNQVTINNMPLEMEDYQNNDHGFGGFQLPTFQNVGNVASQVSGTTGDVTSTAIGNALSINE